ncbi:MAG: TIGR02921 family PEP-CTERM protein [Cyanobacteria bacterium P01_A01_bin.114]
MKTALHILSHAIFWSWNLGFLAIVYLFILPEAGFEIFQAARDGTIPPTFLISIIGILVIPLACTLVGGLRLRKHPILLMRLFYGVEAPLFALCLLRLFLIREMTVGVGYVLGLLAVSMLMFAVEIVAGYAAYRRGLAWVQIISHSLILAMGLYVGTLLLLYTVPALCVFLYSFFQFRWLNGMGWLLREPWQLLIFLLFGLSCILFFAMPYVMTNFYVRSWWRIFTAFGKQYGYGRSGGTSAISLLLSTTLFITLQSQPQAKAFDLLASPPQTAAAQRALLDQSEQIRVGLVNAYLSNYRYLSPWEDSNQLRSMYRHVFNLSDPAVQFWQNIHNGLLSPFLYRGTGADVEKAADLYAQFFDAPIQKAERPEIRKALQATANRDETQAGLLNLDQKIVRLASQSFSVNEQGDWAEVEMHELYENKTFQEQEIFYSFSLPESAVITGLWLGEDETSPRFKFVVSPRGAAQQVYKGEVERSNWVRADDPALLEQVGPRQYRMRVFPIPAATMATDEEDASPGLLHLWMTYQVMQQADGWPLPQVTEKRNLFSEESWSEETVISATQAAPVTHEVALPEGYRVTATPLDRHARELPKNQRLAVILDSSYSMTAHTQDLQQAFKTLKQVASDNTLDFYLTTTAGEATAPTQTLKQFEQATFYGSLQPAEMLQQFDQQRGPQTYDAILLITDEGSYELAKATALPALTAPLWLIHLGGKLPAAYEDKLPETLQTTQGSVTTDVISALQRIPPNPTGDIIDEYTWSITPTEPSPSSPSTPSPSPNFTPLATRQLILQKSRTADLTQLAALDKVHAIAKRTEIVTPYSSMLVLVNDRQRELLREAEANRDRFDREVEDGQDELTQPNNPLNSTASVPEPGQVLGLGVSAVALILLKRKQRRG